MPDSIQVRDLLEMLERIEDKSAPVVARNLREPVVKGNRWHDELVIISVERTGPRQWSVLTEAPSVSLVEELADSCDLDSRETARAEKAEHRAGEAEDALKDILRIAEDQLATIP